MPVRRQPLRLRCKAWDDDWHKINEQMHATAREMDMAVMKWKLATEEAMFCACRSFRRIVGQHDACAQARSFKPSVKASASKLKKIILNRQKQMRRRTRRALKNQKEKTQCCLIDSFRGLGFKVSYVCDGPFRVLEDGSKMLKPFGYIIKAVPRIYSTGPGRWIVCKDGHCFALRRKGERKTWSIDGADRKRVAARDLDTLMKGSKISKYPVDVSYYAEVVIPIAVRVSPPREIALFEFPQRQHPYERGATH